MECYEGVEEEMRATHLRLIGWRTIPFSPCCGNRVRLAPCVEGRWLNEQNVSFRWCCALFQSGILAVPDDHVCVTQATRNTVVVENELAPSRTRNGGPYGGDTCLVASFGEKRCLPIIFVSHQKDGTKPERKIPGMRATLLLSVSEPYPAPGAAPSWRHVETRPPEEERYPLISVGSFPGKVDGSRMRRDRPGIAVPAAHIPVPPLPGRELKRWAVRINSLRINPQAQRSK